MRGYSVGFTIIELLVVIAIISLLAALLVPLAGGAIERARRVQCKSNLKQCGLACLSYADDHNGMYPTFKAPNNTTDVGNNLEHSNIMEKWGLLFPEYLRSIDVYWCPSRRRGERYAMYTDDYLGKPEFGVGVGKPYCESSYGHISGSSAFPIRDKDITEPSHKLVAIDVFWMDAPNGVGGAPACHGDGYYNTLYYDMHVSSFIDSDKYLESISVGGGHGSRIEQGYAYVEDND